MEALHGLASFWYFAHTFKSIFYELRVISSAKSKGIVLVWEQLFGLKQSPKVASSYLIDWASVFLCKSIWIKVCRWFHIQEDAPRNHLAWLLVIEEEILGNWISCWTTFSLALVYSAFRIKPVLNTEKLPKSATKIASSAANMDRYDFSLWLSVPDHRYLCLSAFNFFLLLFLFVLFLFALLIITICIDRQKALLDLLLHLLVITNLHRLITHAQALNGQYDAKSHNDSHHDHYDWRNYEIEGAASIVLFQIEFLVLLEIVLVLLLIES